MATVATAGARSPMSSPRLPSPPPMAEDQTGPRSPLPTPQEAGRHTRPPPKDQAALRRIRPGTKAADMSEGPPLAEFSEIDSAFQLTEHLKALHHSYTHPPHLDVTQPITRSTASLLASVPPGVDRSLWLYELCRFLVQKINVIITSLFMDTPPCSAATCPEMRASEWQYLCAVHDPPKSCCAIDYCCHTLDWAANTLTSPTHFPSRLTLGPATDGTGGGQGAPGTSRGHQERQLTNVFRRVYRILAHAWFQHRDVFWRVEGRTGLYVLFKTVCDSYSLIPEDNYTIPASAEGLEEEDAEGRFHLSTADETKARTPSTTMPVGILKKEGETKQVPREDRDRHVGILEGATAKRHKHAPSSSSSTFSTVIEENEEDEGQKPPSPEFPTPLDDTAKTSNDRLPSEPSNVTTKAGDDLSAIAQLELKEETKSEQNAHARAGSVIPPQGPHVGPREASTETTIDNPLQSSTEAEVSQATKTEPGEPSAASISVED